MRWTRDQQRVIEIRNKDILVSAAAGSGKTAVLVERIIERITRDENPTSIDRMLIVTFTKAAASEMRERILKAVTKAAIENPENQHIQKQMTYIHSAKITTFDSFCNSIVKDNFADIDLDPSFRTASEDELSLIKKDVMEKLLEEAFMEEDSEFLECYEKKGGNKKDNMFAENIRQLFRYSESNPSPEDWLDECIRMYEEKGDILERPWVKLIKKYIDEVIDNCLNMYSEILDMSYEDEAFDKYKVFFTQESEEIKEIKLEKDFFKKSNMINNYSFASMPRISSDADVDIKARIQKNRESIKKNIASLKERYIYLSKEELEKEEEDNYKIVKVIVSLTKRFRSMYREYKKEHNIVDFSDIEHFALQILTTTDAEGHIVQTAAAREIASQFDDIMIDEYQDSNMVQERLIQSLVDKDDGRNYVFMVGDVKQSIYKFRLAKPEIFIDKYNRFPAEDVGDSIRITLGMNFRSRKEVLNTVNFIFDQIMAKDLGGIEYDESHMLYNGAEYEQDVNPDQNSELILVDTKDEKAAEKLTIEAVAIAKRIKELIASGFLVKDKKTGLNRKVTYRDIVILTRTSKGIIDAYVKVLSDRGVPVYAETNTGFYGTLEISTILNILQIIDNPTQDIPFVSVMKNMYNFSSMELAFVKAYVSKYKGKDRNRSFYEEVLYFTEGDNDIKEDIVSIADNDTKEDEESIPRGEMLLRNKLQKFITQLNHFRDIVPFTSLSKLIGVILDETNFGYFIEAMPAGDKRMANIKLLIEKAHAYENTSYTGLFNFVRFIDLIKEIEVETGEATVLSEEDDTVRIMTIHKSKGLEFPVVILAATGKAFNRMDSRKREVIHEVLGIGTDRVNLNNRTLVRTPHKAIIAKEIEKDLISEELRVLYVALTRAKEKLIVIGSCNVDTKLKKIAHFRTFNPEKFDPVAVMGAENYLEWILMASVRNSRIYEDLYEYSAILGEYPKDSIYFETDASLEFRVMEMEEFVDEDVEDAVIAEAMRDKLSKWRDTKSDISFEFTYPYEAVTRIHSKYSVSEIKKMNLDKFVDEFDEIYETKDAFSEDTHNKESYIPEFIKSREVLAGASRGTAYHRVFQLLDYKEDISSKEKLESQIHKLCEDGYINEAMAKSVDSSKILEFVNSDIGKRMKKAADANLLRREQAYVMGVPASEVEKTYEGDEIVLVQGAIDAFFEEYAGEDSEVVIVDYKTDNVANIQALETLYKSQLVYYAKAIQQITGKKVKECIIYSVKFSKELVIKYD